MRVFIPLIVLLISAPSLAQQVQPQSPNTTIKLKEKLTYEELNKASAQVKQIAVKNPAYKKIILKTLPLKGDKIDAVAFLAGSVKRQQSFLDRDQKSQIKKIAIELKSRKLQNAKKTWRSFLGSLKGQNKPLDLNALIGHIVVTALLSEQTDNLKNIQSNIGSNKVSQQSDTSLVDFSAAVARVATFIKPAIQALHAEALEVTENLK